jgi:hypothetical protein
MQEVDYVARASEGMSISMKGVVIGNACLERQIVVGELIAERGLRGERNIGRGFL